MFSGLLERRGRVLAWAALRFAAAALSAGAGASAPDSEEAEAELDVETILANPLGADDYRDGQRCISNRGYRNIEVLDEGNLLFVGRQRTWLNRLRGRCAGLRDDMIIYLDVHGSRVCELDHFRAQHRGGISIPTPMCMLGGFEEIDPAQVQGLIDAVSAQGGTRATDDEGATAPDDDGG